MGIPKGSKRVSFPKVLEAREALANKALELFKIYETLIREALAAGEFEVASDALQFLMKHMPKDSNGVSLLETSIDKVSDGRKALPAGPKVQIGIAVGGTPNRIGLPAAQAEIIEISTDEDAN